MDTLQDSVQICQQFSPLSSETSESSFSAPLTEETTPTEDREPLRVVSSNNNKENKESPEQEQEDKEEENSENKDSVTDYVSKVLEKLIKQRNKVAKLTTVLEKKGLLTERKVSQDTIQENDTENSAKENFEDDTCNSNSKENLSPVKSKPESKAEAAVASPGPKNALDEKKTPTNLVLENVLQVSKREISYGNCFPGQIVEEHLDIVNKSGHDFVVQIIVSCLNEDLQDTEEYVYSIRRSHLYDYNDKHYLIMAPYSVASFNLAMKVPSMKMNDKIMGKVDVSVQGATGNYTIDLSANVTIPKVFCPKELHFKGLDYKIVKLAIKEGKKQEFKIPIRNQSDVPVTLELEFHEPRSESEQRPHFDCMMHPNVITVAPNSNTITSLLMKPRKSMGADKPKSERKILVGRVKDSALIYSFVFWVEAY